MSADCVRCGHRREAHILPGKKCRTRIAYGWDEKKQAFAKTCACRCPEYKAPPSLRDCCPHDYVRGNPNCIYCHRARVP